MLKPNKAVQMLISYEAASMLIYQQSIVHIVSSLEVDSTAAVSILRRFLLLKLIPFTLARAPAAHVYEGFHVFVDAAVTTPNSVFLTASTPVALEYVISPTIQVVDDGLLLLQLMHVFDSKRLNEQLLSYYRQVVKQQSTYAPLKESQSLISRSQLPKHDSSVARDRTSVIYQDMPNQHPRILRIIQENNMLFAKRPEPQPREVAKEEPEEVAEEYSVDLDEESTEEDQTSEPMSESMQRFIVETQESYEIDVNIHRRLYNQYQFEDSQMPSTYLAKQEDFEETGYSEEETSEESLLSSTGDQTENDYDKIKHLTESYLENPTKVHPLQFFTDFTPSIEQEQFAYLSDRIRRTISYSQQEQQAKLLSDYYKMVSHSYPCSFKSALITLAFASGVDVSDKNFIDQVVFSSFVGGIAYYQRHYTDIKTIQRYQQQLRQFVIEYDGKTQSSRPYLTFTDYNIRGLRLVPLFQALQISALKNIICCQSFNVYEFTAKTNHMLAKLGVAHAEAQAVFVTFNKNAKRAFKKNYFMLSRHYSNQYQFYVPNFVYSHYQLKTIEISAADVVCLLLANAYKYAYMDFDEIAFLMQKSVLGLDSLETQDDNYQYYKDVSGFLSHQLFLQNQMYFLKLAYDESGLFIYNMISDHDFSLQDFQELSSYIKQEKIMQDYLTYNKKAPNKLLQQLYEQGKLDMIPTMRGCRFIRVRFKPVDMLFQDCAVCVFSKEQCYVDYAKSGFIGGIVGYYLQDADDWSRLNRLLSSTAMRQIRQMFEQWKQK